MMSGRFEEALQTVSSVRDFSMVYDAYVQSEMHMMEILIQTVIVFNCYHTQGEEEESAMTQESETMMASSAPSEELQELTSTSESLSLRRARLEHLISSQPIMLNNVRLRQNPHDIRQWLYRVSLFTDPAKGAVSAPQPEGRSRLHRSRQNRRPPKNRGKTLPAVDRVRAFLRAFQRPAKRPSGI